MPIVLTNVHEQFDMEEIDLPPKRRKVSTTFPVQVALQIRKKYHRLQQRHSPFSTTARRLLLSRDRAREPLPSIERRVPRARSKKKKKTLSNNGSSFQGEFRN